MSIEETQKLANSRHNQHSSDVMKPTLAAQPTCAKIGRPTAAPPPSPELLQWVDVLKRQCEVVWGDDVCLSEKRRSLQIVGTTRTDVESG